MPHPMISVEPSLPIQQATLLIQEQHIDWVGYERDGQRWLSHQDDLFKMISMGLDTLPVESITIPEQAPPLQTDHAQPSTSCDFSRRLTSYFPVYFVAALYELQSLLQRFEVNAYVIGGISRDLLMLNEKRLSVHDVDITLEGDALAFSQFLTENSRNFILEGEFPEFGTAKVRYKDNLMFDIASTRQEIYPHCGALPVVVNRGVPLANDIIRRDFTINALAFSIHDLGCVLDYATGIQDVQQGLLRVMHPVSFFEDPSRIVRAMKFCARFNFKLAPETHQLLLDFMIYGGQCYKGGGDRIKQELKGFLGVEESEVKSKWVRFFVEASGYRLMNMDMAYTPSADLIEQLTHIHEVLPEVMGILSSYLDRDFNFDTYLCFLLRDMPAEEFLKTAHRMGLTRNEREFVEQFRKLKDNAQTRFGSLHELSSAVEIYDLFHGLHLITVTSCLVLLGFSDRKRMKIVLEAFLKYKRKWEKLELELDGNDLMDLGVPEGKQIGQLLSKLRQAKLAGHLPERMDEVQYIQIQLSSVEALPASGETPPQTPAPSSEASADAS